MSVIKNPILSIIVPVHNTKEYLPTCLDTLRSQTLEDIEVLIIDDNSEQDLKPVLKLYLDDPRFYSYRLEQCLGPGGARNAGLSYAKGCYIAFCDSDDWVDLNYFKTAVEYMEQYNADIGMCSLMRETNGIRGDKIFKCKYDDIIKMTPDMTIKIMTYQFDAGIKVIPSSTNKIYRSDFLAINEFHFEEHMYFQDVFFAFQTILRAERLICIPSVRYHHFRRPNSIIQSFDQKHIDDFCRLFTLISSFLKAEGIYERYCFNYYKLCEHFYNIIIREIFQFVSDENEKKRYICASFDALKQVVNVHEYLEYTSAEKLRCHLQPHIDDTTLY